MKLPLPIALALALAASPAVMAFSCGPKKLIGLELLSVVTEPVALDYVVKSVIYGSEDLNTMFLTLRGGGISVYDVQSPAAPVLLDHYPPFSDDSEVDPFADVEGQDRIGDLLVVIGRQGWIFTFDVSDRENLVELGRLELTTDPSLFEEVGEELQQLVGNGPFGALHVALDVIGVNTYAFATATATGELIAVDVTDPENPVQVGALDTGVQYIEGIYIKDHHAFVGGFGFSDTYKAVDVSDPTDMQVVQTLTDDIYRQMVPEMNAFYFPNVLFAALWNTNGGLGTFDVTNPASFSQLDAIARPELTMANRVKLTPQNAYLPLEQEPGGLAIIDVTDTSDLEFVGLATGIQSISTPYTLELNRDHVYLFGTTNASMAILKARKGTVKKRFSRWKFGAGTTAAALAGSGVAATQGAGKLFFLDPADTGSSGTAAKYSTGTTGGITHLTLDGDAGDGTWGVENGFFMQHNLLDTYYGKIPQYTVIWDVLVPQSSFDADGDGCFSGALSACADLPLYQLDRTNGNDADLFLKVGDTLASDNGFVGKEGDPVLGGGLGGYAQAILPDTWHRVAMVVDLRETTDQAKIYVNGSLVQTASEIDHDLFAGVSQGDPTVAGLIPPTKEGFLMLADNDGEMHTELRLSSFLFVDKALTAAEIAAMGTPTNAGIPAP